MMRPEGSRVLVIGIGNEYRRDDAVGLIVARRVKERAPDGLTVMEASGEGTALMELWRDADTVILIDAVQSGAQAGTTRRYDAHAQPVPAQFFHCSTHAFGVAEAIELARALNRLPLRLIVYGIEGANFEAGVGLSAKVEKAADEVVESVLAHR